MTQILHHRAVRIVVMFIGVYALIVMSGWIFDIEQLTRIAPIGINMKFITAFLFLMSAIELYCISKTVQEEDEIALMVLPGVSLIIFLVTMTLIVGRLLNIPTGIEGLFLTSASSGSSMAEGWPSFLTLVIFIFFGLAGIASLFHGFLRERTLFLLGWIILAISLSVILGYLFNVSIFGTSVPMALNTALCFSFLGFGVIQAHKPQKIL